MNYINITEFRERGYLQEVNRRLLHPLGLALEIVQDEDGSERLGGVWDYRDDPEGMYFAEVDVDKAMAIETEIKLRKPLRLKSMGYFVQPIEEAEIYTSDPTEHEGALVQIISSDYGEKIRIESLNDEEFEDLRDNMQLPVENYTTDGKD